MVSSSFPAPQPCNTSSKSPKELRDALQVTLTPKVERDSTPPKSSPSKRSRDTSSSLVSAAGPDQPPAASGLGRLAAEAAAPSTLVPADKHVADAAAISLDKQPSQDVVGSGLCHAAISLDEQPSQDVVGSGLCHAPAVSVRPGLAQQVVLRGLNVQYPFSQLLLKGAKTIEVRKVPLGHHKARGFRKGGATGGLRKKRKDHRGP